MRARHPFDDKGSKSRALNHALTAERALAGGLGAVVDPASWPVPAEMRVLAALGAHPLAHGHAEVLGQSE